MENLAQVVKEFRFYPESLMVTVVFQDDRTDDFMGEDNYKPAHHAAIKASQFSTETTELSLIDQTGKTVVLTVPAETPHETFDL